MTPRRYYPFLILLFFTGCGNDDGTSSPPDNFTDAQLAEKRIAKAKECAVYFPPQDPKFDTVQDETDRCLARCTFAASCNQLQAAWCGEGLADGDSLRVCADKCPQSPKDGFACSNGETIPFLEVCDGLKTCKSGEDEKNCIPFVCESGEEIVRKDIVCSLGFECEDGSDEDNCPFTCQLHPRN